MNLHERLTAAVQERLEVARAATPAPWTAYQSSTPGYDDKRDWFISELARFRGHLLNNVYFDDDEATAQYIALHDPADAILRYERDLKVLERHAPFDQSDWSAARGSFTHPGCEYCQLTSNDGESLARDWPCDEIRDLATAYDIGVTE